MTRSFQFFKQHWPSVVALASSWAFAAFFYVLSGATDPQAQERRIDAILQQLDATYLRGSPEPGTATPDEKRHLVLANFLHEQSLSIREQAYSHLAIAFFVAGWLVLGVDF